MLNVYVEDNDLGIIAMFDNKEGYNTVKDLEDADLVVFSGGFDVDPSLYGEQKHPTTYSSLPRDEACLNLFNSCKERGVPMVGICRGSQFLHVANGEKLWQHVDGHATGRRHRATEKATGETYDVTSTHHQMMRYPFSEGSTAVLVATASESTFQLSDTSQNTGPRVDVEVVYHPKTNSLCVQSHPEYVSEDDPFQLWFFDLVDRYIWEGVQ